MTDYAIKSHLQRVQQSTGQTEVMTLGIKVSKDSPDKEKNNSILFKQGVNVQQAFPPWKGNDFNAITPQLSESKGQIWPFAIFKCTYWAYQLDWNLQ